MTENVRWFPVLGYEGLYDVSDTGCVRNAKTYRQLVPYMQGKYPAVTLHKDKQRVVQRLHVLVLTAFKGERPEGHVGAHLDGDTGNANAANLAWVIPAENEQHKVAHGTSNHGRRPAVAKFTDAQVEIIREAHSSGLSVQKLAVLTGVYRSTIHDIINESTYSPSGRQRDGEAGTPSPPSCLALGGEE